MAIFNHPGANPPSTEPNVQVIWTRNNVDTVKASLGQAYPYFTYKPLETEGRDNTDGPQRIYTYAGHYRISTAEIATKEEVLDFVKARGQSQAAKPASVWQDKLNSTWLKVTLRKCPEEEQGVNPMES